jgi:hypothetical protein
MSQVDVDGLRYQRLSPHGQLVDERLAAVDGRPFRLAPAPPPQCDETRIPLDRWSKI